MLEVNWNQPPPRWNADVVKLWQEIEITPVAFYSEPILAYLDHVSQTHVNGGGRFAGFHLGSNLTLDWYASRNRLEEMGFFTDFLCHQVVMAHLPDLKINKPLRAEPEVTYTGSLTLDGELAETLVNGGAYEKFKGSAAHAKELGQAVCYSLFHDRYEDVLVYRTGTPWCAWFEDIAWDVTWFILDKRQRYLWLLCGTDVD